MCANAAMKDSAGCFVPDKSDDFVRVRLFTHQKFENQDKESQAEILAELDKQYFKSKLSVLFENFEKGKEAIFFRELSSFVESKTNVFLFNFMLTNRDTFQNIIDVITKDNEDLKNMEITKFIHSYLRTLAEEKNLAKRILNCDDFPNAFCSKSEYHISLKINFDNSSSTLKIDDIFKTSNSDEKFLLDKLELYDDGHKVVTVTRKLDKTDYVVKSDGCCQLTIKRCIDGRDYMVVVDINSGEIIDLEFKISNVLEDPWKCLRLPFLDTFLINGKQIREVLNEYLAIMKSVHDRDCKHEQDQCLPIKTLQELRFWKPPGKKHHTQNLKQRLGEPNRPKTLVCHDMKGGYLEDRYVHGVKEKDVYSFFHWSSVDIFVYFSHHLVTIPPCGWISAAHTNGVKVLGTFITEWTEGSKICESVFEDENSVQLFCMQLVNIALHFNFDGWLINIENKLKACQISLLRKFLVYLTARMHSYCPGSQVIWYDSVIKNGDLRWQNALNDVNRIFFNACDGIFLNYNWTDKHLLRSVEEAGARRTDVYVGADVFGRGCPGGGGYCTNVAFREARKFGLSVAIFAPGWVYECCDVKDLTENQMKFWNLLLEFCPPRALQELPFTTSFCPGFGLKTYRGGMVINSKPWFNLSVQQPQPMFYMNALPNDRSVAPYDKDGYDGGGCIHLKGKFNEEMQPIDFEIFKTHFQLTGTCEISYIFKPLVENVEISVTLKMTSKEKTYSVCLGHEAFGSNYANVDTNYLGYTSQLQKGDSKSDTWIQRLYKMESVNFCGHSITGISVTVHPQKDLCDPNVSLLLGGFEVSLDMASPSFTYHNLVSSCDEHMVKIKCDLQWHFPYHVSCFDLFVVLDGERRHLCTTNQSFFEVDLQLDPVSTVGFFVSPQEMLHQKRDSAGQILYVLGAPPEQI